ncbi:MAG TPA: metallophosphoesterase [Longimicrobiales bacterium]|nr:metallophosphoesterase [Longimicrobiales bacterium]
MLLVAVALGGCAPARSTQADPPVLRAVVISDLNASYGSTHYPDEVSLAVKYITGTWNPDLVLVAGDMVAGQSTQLTDSTVRAMWEAFDSVVAAPLRAARIPLVVTMGNHDASAYPAHARDRRIAAEYWRGSPSAYRLAFTDSQYYPLRYAVRYGDVFVVAWDATNQESAADDELLDWLRQSLSSAEAVAARHRVVLGHLPLYAVAQGRDRAGEVLKRGDLLRERLEEWGATLFVSGHHHAYYPARRGGLDLLHAGAVGDGPRQLLGSREPGRKTVSVLDFLSDSVAITTYVIDATAAAPTLLPIEFLPPLICSASGWVARRDLPPGDTVCNASSGSGWAWR